MPPWSNPTVTGSSVYITVCWLPCCRTRGRLRLSPHLTQDPRGCFPAPRPQVDNEPCCSAAWDMPGWSQINNSHPKGDLTEATHSWRQNRWWCQWQAWSHIPTKGMALEFPGVGGKWIYFKPSQGRRALPGLCAQVLLVVSGCLTTKTYSNLEFFQPLFTRSDEPGGQWSQHACSSSILMKGYSIYCINKLFTLFVEGKCLPKAHRALITASGITRNSKISEVKYVKHIARIYHRML